MTEPTLTPEQLQQLHDLARLDPILADHVRDYDRSILTPNEEEPLSLRPVKNRWTSSELAAAHFSDPRWAVPDMLPVGLSVLAGRPKLGKSWLALQIAQAVCTGGRVFNTPVPKGKVLFLALEDSPRRLKKRLEMQHAQASDDLVFYTAWKPFPDGGLVDLANEVTVHSFTLVIVDTISRAVGKADQLDPAEMTTIIGNLQQIGMNADIAILAIDHHRKNNGYESNPIDDILGSTAKAAAADAAMGLYKQQGKQGATLKIIGRELEEHELALAWDPECCCWQCLGAADEVRKDSVKGEVLQAIKSMTEEGEPATPSRIAKYLSQNRSMVSQMLADLWTSGRIRKAAKIGREQPYEPI